MINLKFELVLPGDGRVLIKFVIIDETYIDRNFYIWNNIHFVKNYFKNLVWNSLSIICKV